MYQASVYRVEASTANIPPCGSLSTEYRPIDRSAGGNSTCPPSATACPAARSQSCTAKYTIQCGEMSAGHCDALIGWIPQIAVSCSLATRYGTSPSALCRNGQPNTDP